MEKLELLEAIKEITKGFPENSSDAFMFIQASDPSKTSDQLVGFIGIGEPIPLSSMFCCLLNQNEEVRNVILNACLNYFSENKDQLAVFVNHLNNIMVDKLPNKN